VSEEILSLVLAAVSQIVLGPCYQVEARMCFNRFLLQRLWYVLPLEVHRVIRLKVVEITSLYTVFNIRPLYNRVKSDNFEISFVIVQEQVIYIATLWTCSWASGQRAAGGVYRYK